MCIFFYSNTNPIFYRFNDFERSFTSSVHTHSTHQFYNFCNNNELILDKITYIPYTLQKLTERINRIGGVPREGPKGLRLLFSLLYYRQGGEKFKNRNFNIIFIVKKKIQSYLLNCLSFGLFNQCKFFSVNKYF